MRRLSGACFHALVVSPRISSCSISKSWPDAVRVSVTSRRDGVVTGLEMALQKTQMDRRLAPY